MTKTTNMMINGTEFTEDDVSLVEKGAIKYDGGKPCVYRGVVEYFPRAVMSVAAISTFGAKKYAWKGWEQVPEGFERYSDAMMRHIMAEAKGEDFDPDSGMLHAAHAAWGALARLELLLREQEQFEALADGLTDEEFDELVEWANKMMSAQNEVG